MKHLSENDKKWVIKYLFYHLMTTAMPHFLQIFINFHNFIFLSFYFEYQAKLETLGSTLPLYFKCFTHYLLCLENVQYQKNDYLKAQRKTRNTEESLMVNELSHKCGLLIIMKIITIDLFSKQIFCLLS